MPQRGPMQQGEPVRQADTARHFLHPGAARFAENPERIETILGSCVSVSLRDPYTAFSAICHCVLPEAPPAALAAERFRFCDTAVEGMLEWFAHRRVPPSRLEVKVFGGAEVLFGGNGTSVGQLNAQCALAVLARHGLTPQSQATGGAAGRYLVFDTASGAVWIRPLTQEYPL
jgi:chemotaxis protein CheD